MRLPLTGCCRHDACSHARVKVESTTLLDSGDRIGAVTCADTVADRKPAPAGGAPSLRMRSINAGRRMVATWRTGTARRATNGVLEVSQQRGSSTARHRRIDRLPATTTGALISSSSSGVPSVSSARWCNSCPERTIVTTTQNMLRSALRRRSVTAILLHRQPVSKQPECGFAAAQQQRRMPPAVEISSASRSEYRIASSQCIARPSPRPLDRGACGRGHALQRPAGCAAVTVNRRGSAAMLPRHR